MHMFSCRLAVAAIMGDRWPGFAETQQATTARADALHSRATSILYAWTVRGDYHVAEHEYVRGESPGDGPFERLKP